MATENQPDSRPVKAADVKKGDHVFDDAGAPVEVTHIQTFQRRGRDLLLLVTADGDSNEYETDDTVHIASETVVERAREAAERPKRIAEMRAFLDWIEANPDLPVPYMRAVQAYPVGDWDEQVAEVHRVAGKLGVKPQRYETQGREVVTLDYGSGDQVRYTLYASRPKPVEQASSEPQKPELAGFEVVEVGQKLPHYQTAGWKGGDNDGDCGAECACGVTYDGFDTLGAACELLDKHIAEGNARSVEDVAPRGTDAAEEHAPVPADVDGFGHERGKPAWNATSGEQPTVRREGGA